MNKKIILASLVLFSAIPILASAIVSYGIVQNDEVPAREVVSGSPSDIPYIRSSFKLYKGWNLIPSPGEGIAAPERTKAIFFGYPRQMGCGVKENDFSGYQVKYMYAHVPGRGYIGGKVNYNNNGFESSVQQEFENATRAFYLSPEMGGNDGIWSFYLTSWWVYSDIECEYPLAQVAVRDVARYQEGLKKTKLVKGWNLIFMSPGFYNDDVRELIGGCNVLQINQWDPSTQKWQYSSSESQQQVNTFLNTGIDKNNLYTPMVVKVAETCTLGRSATAPPELPN